VTGPLFDGLGPPSLFFSAASPDKIARFQRPPAWPLNNLSNHGFRALPVPRDDIQHPGLCRASAGSSSRHNGPRWTPGDSDTESRPAHIAGRRAAYLA
jgi:hypothetical protein